MKKFKVKNRPKRKYTRHTVPSTDTYQSSTLLAGLLPTIILAVAFIAMLFINMNLREHTVSIQPQLHYSLPKLSLADILKPIQSLPNLFIEPAAFFAGLFILIVTSIQNTFLALGNGIVWIVSHLDPRPVALSAFHALQTLFTGLGTTGILLAEGFGRVGELLVQSVVSVGTNFITGVQTIWAITVEYAIRGATIIWSALTFIFQTLFAFVWFILQGIISIIVFIADKISAFFSAVFHIISIPFQILGVFWLKIKPFVDILGQHFGMAGADLADGFNSFGKLGNALSNK